MNGPANTAMSGAAHDHADHGGHTGHATHYDSWGDFFGAYWTNLADPAHLAAELTYFVVLDVLLLGLVLTWLNKRRVEREHRRIDAEHGYVHADEHAEARPRERATR